MFEPELEGELRPGRSHAALRIYHDDLDPDGLTQRIGIAPSAVYKKGQPSPEGGRLVPNINGWFYSSLYEVAEDDLWEHVGWLLNEFQDKRAILDELRSQGCQIELTCHWVAATGGTVISFDSEIVRRLAELQLGVLVEIVS
jgi:hypothetical protein